MLYDLLSKQVDFYYINVIFYLTVFALLAYNIERKNYTRVSWSFLFLYSILHIIFYFLHLIVVYSQNLFFHKIAVIFYIGGFVVFIEFARFNLHKVFNIKIKVYIYLLILFLLIPFLVYKFIYFLRLLTFAFVLYAMILNSYLIIKFVDKKRMFFRSSLIAVLNIYFFTFLFNCMESNKFIIFTIPYEKIFSIVMIIRLCAIIIIIAILWYIYEINKNKLKLTNMKMSLLMLSIIIISWVMISIIGYYYSSYLGNKRENEMRKEFISIIKTSASSISYSDIENLHRDSTDLENFYYYELKKQLQFFKQMNNRISNVYIYSKQNKYMQFLVDDANIKSANFIMPGEIDSIYPLSDRDIEIFYNGFAFIDGPYFDEFGVWISGSAPIINPYNNSIIAVLGMDIDANKWASDILFYRMSSIGMMLLTLVILFIGFLIYKMKKDLSSRLMFSEINFKILFNNARDAVIMMNGNTGKIITTNIACERLLKSSRKKIKGNYFVQYISDKYREDFESRFLEHLNNHDSVPLELEITDSKNNIIPVELNASLVEIENEINVVHCIIRDITERKRYDMEKQQMYKEVEQLQKLELIGQLASGVAHDFNNILNIITLNSDMILEIKDMKKIKKHINIILDAANNAKHLNRELLTFARKGHYKNELINCHETIKRSLIILENSIDKKINLKKSFKAKQFYIKGDPGQLQSAILNLCTNARDAIQKGGTITIKTENVYINKDEIPYDFIESGVYIKISVIDNGIGISEENILHLFEPFFTTKETGTGLGLASVYGYVKRVNGFIDIESEINKGSKFHLYLPIYEKKNIDVSEIKEYRKTTRKVNNRRKNKGTIFVVEDQENIRKVLTSLLKLEDYSVIEACNGEEALKIFEEKYKEIDIVMLDMIMPIMDGTETYMEMKKIDPNIKVLISTGYSAERKARDILKDEKGDFIQKPFRKSEVLEKIEKLLKE